MGRYGSCASNADDGSPNAVSRLSGDLRAKSPHEGWLGTEIAVTRGASVSFNTFESDRFINAPLLSNEYRRSLDLLLGRLARSDESGAVFPSSLNLPRDLLCVMFRLETDPVIAGDLPVRRGDVDP